MKEYFQLQLKLSSRKLREMGIHPVLAILLAVLLFVFSAVYNFENSSYLPYLIGFVTVSLQLKLSVKERSDFLGITFSDRIKKQIRIIENLLIFFPFALGLIYRGSYLLSGLLFLVSIILALDRFNFRFNKTLPTPFSKNPFEFSVGFRKTYFIYPLVYGLTAVAIMVENQNLGIFSLLVVYLIASFYYSKPEEEYYVWIQAETPKTFLFKKLKIATKSAFILALPILSCLLVFFYDAYFFVLLSFVGGFLFLWMIIVAKYSVYPQEMNLLEGVLITVSILFPPLVLLVLPYFFSKSVNRLKPLLDDKDSIIK